VTHWYRTDIVVLYNRGNGSWLDSHFIMGSSVARTSKKLDPRCSQHTQHHTAPLSYTGPLRRIPYATRPTHFPSVEGSRLSLSWERTRYVTRLLAPSHQRVTCMPIMLVPSYASNTPTIFTKFHTTAFVNCNTLTHSVQVTSVLSVWEKWQFTTFQ